jgi:hypothetical protein
MRLLPRLCAGLPAAAACLSLLASAHAQATQPQSQAPPPAVYTPTSLAPEPGLPRTADGHPDLQGVVWTTNFFPVFEALPMSLPLVLPEPMAQQLVAQMAQGFLGSGDVNVKLDPEVSHLIGATDGLPIVRGERRTRLVVLPATGRIPYTEAARAEIGAYDWLKLPSDNPEERPITERCLVQTGSPPASTTISLNPRQFIQTADYVVIHSEYGDEARIIPFPDARHPVRPPTPYGTSLAHWEGDTLVVETTDLPASDRLRFFQPLVVNPDAKVIERFTRLSARELLYQFTVEDPKAYTAPWLAEYSLFAADKRMFPWSCHEANYSLTNILLAARMAERVAGRANR